MVLEVVAEDVELFLAAYAFVGSVAFLTVSLRARCRACASASFPSSAQHLAVDAAANIFTVLRHAISNASNCSRARWHTKY